MTTDIEPDARVGYLTRRFVTAINGGQPAEMAALFVPDSLVVTEPGRVVQPQDQEHGGGFDLLAAVLPTVYEGDDLALLLVEWTVHSTDPVTGDKFHSTGRACDVGIRGSDGVWRVIIDNGSGSGSADASSVLGADDSGLDGETGRLTSRFRDALNGEDWEGLRDLFGPASVFVSEVGVEATGPEREAALRSLAGCTLRTAVRHSYVAGDVAHVIVDWALEGATEFTGTAANVLRRGTDGHWRYAICNPFGSAPYRDSSERVRSV